MRRNLFFASASIALSAGLLTAQISDPNPAQKPNVFLGNGPKDKKEKRATSRYLRGTVTDDSGKPLEGALVTLLNTKDGVKTTYITKKDGRYSFSDLSFTNDYEVAARFKNQQSEPRKLSQYDRTVSIVRILQVGEPASSADAAKKDVVADQPK